MWDLRSGASPLLNCGGILPALVGGRPWLSRFPCCWSCWCVAAIGTLGVLVWALFQAVDTMRSVKTLADDTDRELMPLSPKRMRRWTP